MFGYVKPLASDLLVKENEFYKSTYCGICRSMKKHTGTLSCATITYDSVFLALVRMAYIPDSALDARMGRCIAHPLKKRCMLVDNEAIEYTARAFAILSYYKVADDINDEGAGKKILLGMARPVLSGAKKRADIDELEEIAREKLSAITKLENEKCPSVDIPAALFGELLGEFFAYGLSGEDRLVTYECGYHLGKFIYAADAAEDWGEDIAMGKYNPFALLYGDDFENETYRREIHGVLTYSASLAAEALDRLDLSGKDAARNILMNTLCSGLSMRIGFLIGEDCPDGAFPQIDRKNCRDCGKCRKSKK